MRNQIHYPSLLKCWWKYFIRIFSIAFILGFLISNFLPGDFWSVGTVNADADGVRFDNSYPNLSATIINTGSTFTPGSMPTEFGVYNCKTKGTDPCVPGLPADELLNRQLDAVTIDIPAKGLTGSISSSLLNVKVRVTCGRVQVDIGKPNGGGVLGGKVFDLGQSCGVPVNKTATLTPSCPNNTPTLSASWSVGSGSNCNIYIQAANTANVISSNCNGSWSNSVLPSSGVVVNGGIYHLYASDGATTTDGGQVTVSCVVPPAPQQIVCNDNEVSLDVSPASVNVGQSINFAISGDASTFISDNFGGAVTNCGGPWNSQTCQASQPGNFTWIHTWKHCVGDVNNCSGICTEQAPFNVNQPAPPAPPVPPVPPVPPAPVPGCTPDGSCSAQMPSACGQANTGVDNCGNPCVRQSAACIPQGGQSQSQSQSQTVNVTQAGAGNVGIGTSQVLGVTTLPKTGLPSLAWSALAFIPAGFRMRRFGKLKKNLEDDPNYIWEDRKFKAGYEFSSSQRFCHSEAESRRI